MLDIDRERDPETLRLACKAFEKANRQLIEKVLRLTQEVAELQGLDASQIALKLPQVKLGDGPKKPSQTQAKPPSEPTPVERQPRIELRRHPVLRPIKTE